MEGVRLRDFEAGDRDWLIAEHVRQYGPDGFDASWKPFLEGIIDAFLASRDQAFERGWVARRGADRLGVVLCTRDNPETARLRMLLVLPEARGLGLGKRLVGECVAYARDRGYRRMMLWTFESLRAACALYAASGFRCLSSRPIREFGVDLVEQTWELDL